MKIFSPIITGSADLSGSLDINGQQIVSGSIYITGSLQFSTISPVPNATPGSLYFDGTDLYLGV